MQEQQPTLPTIICDCNRDKINPITPAYYFYNHKQYDTHCLKCLQPYQYQLPDNTVVRVLPEDKINPNFPPYQAYGLTSTKRTMCGKVFPFTYQTPKTFTVTNNEGAPLYFSVYWVEFGTQNPDTQEFTPFPDWFQFTTPGFFQSQQEWTPANPEDKVSIHPRVTSIIQKAYKIITNQQIYITLTQPRNGYDFTHIDISETDRSKLSGFSFNKIRALVWKDCENKYQEMLDTRHKSFLEERAYIEHERAEHGTFLKPAKLIRAILPDLDDKTVTLIASKVAYLLRKAANPDTSIVKVTDKPSDIYIRGDQCFQSCMSGEDQEFFRIYDDLEHTKLAYIESERGAVLARALIHDCVHDNDHDRDPFKMMDRIYFCDEDILVTMQSWATKNGYWYKTQQAASHTEYITPEGETVDTYVHLHCHDLIDAGYQRIPYFDTFYQYDHRNKELGDDVTSEKTQFRETDGSDSQGFIVSSMHCSICDCRLSEDAAYYSDDEYGPYCEGCYYENYRRCENCDETVHVDYIYYIEAEDVSVCDRCRDRYFSDCSDCNEEFHNDNLIYDNATDQHYCEDCYSNLIEEREKEKEEEEEEENE